MNYNNIQTSSITQSALAVLLAIVAWLVVSCMLWLFYLVLFFLVSMLPGLGNNWLIYIMRIVTQMLAFGIGGYWALGAVHYWLSRANLKFVLWAFLLEVFLFMIGLPLFIIFFSPGVGPMPVSWGELAIGWLLAVPATILGAWWAYKNFR